MIFNKKGCANLQQMALRRRFGFVLLAFRNFYFAVLAAFFVIFIFNSVTFAIPPKKNPLPSDYYTGLTWEDAQKNDKPIIVNFYVDWCNACRRFAPIFEKLRKEHVSKYNFVIIKTDNPKNEKIVKQYNIHSFPSVFLIDKKQDKTVFLEQKKYFNMEDLREELDSFLK